MMIRLSARVNIGQFRFDAITGCEIESSWDSLTDSAKITLPRRLSWKGKDIILGKDPILKKGDPVRIELGYNHQNDHVFSGHVTSVSANIPAEIMCQDDMWLLKQATFTKTYKNATLKELLNDLLLSTQIDFVAPDVNLGPLRINKLSPAQVLEKIRSVYLLKSFFRDGVLYVGLAYWPQLQNEHSLRFDTHIVENDLEWVKADDVKIKLKIIVIGSDNKKTEYEYGDKEGEQRTLNYYNIDKEQVDHIGNEEIQRLKYDGYRGSITIFGKPYIKHGDAVNLFDPFYPDRSGRYLVKRVSTEYGMNGYRQNLELDSKI